MRAGPFLLALLAAPLPAAAAWVWDAPLTVNTAQGAAVFPHIESANRRNIAASRDAVGVVWEDNRSGSPRCYLAIKPAATAAFEPEIAVSQGECYEPAVLALGGKRFVVSWEEGGQVHARILPQGKPLQLSTAEAAQATLAARGDRLYAAWAEKAGRFRHVVVARLAAHGDRLEASTPRPIEAAQPSQDQGWPALAVAGDGTLTVAWEDRRERHTVPMVSFNADGRSFAPPVRLSDLRPGGGAATALGLGAGTGAMRPTLTAWGKQGVVAVWLDKRDFLSGYDVYAAFDDGRHHFGKNVQVQDSFGNNIAQWHAQIVGNAAGRLVALWDDARDGTPDVWLADWNGSAFSDNTALPAAAGDGTQSDPVATLDAAGVLHAVWLEGPDAAGTRVRYARASWR